MDIKNQPMPEGATAMDNPLGQSQWKLITDKKLARTVGDLMEVLKSYPPETELYMERIEYGKDSFYDTGEVITAVELEAYLEHYDGYPPVAHIKVAKNLFEED